MKHRNIILAAVLLSLSLTGCGTATEETAGTSSSVETQAGTAEFPATETTEAATEQPTEAKTTEAATEKPTDAEAEGAATAEQKAVFALNGPLARHQGVEEFDSASFAAAFDKADLVKAEDGSFSLTVMIYRYEQFSGNDISQLAQGDVIWCLGEEVVVETVETTDSGAVVINGGIENGGRVLKTEDGSIYFESGMNNRKSYYEIGENTYKLAADFVLTDNADPDAPATYTAEEFLAMEQDVTGFINANTIVETTDGVITAIERVYIP